MSRLEAPNTETLSSAQREVYDRIAASSRGAVREPLAIWLWRPELAERAQSLGPY